MNYPPSIKINEKIIIAITFLFFTLPLLQAQDNDSISLQPVNSNRHHNKALQITGIVLPATLITYGIVSIENGGLKGIDYSTRNEILKDNSMWYNCWDDYFQFSPAVAAFSMKLCGAKSTHKLSDMLILYTLSNVLETGIVYTTKQITSRKRPDGTNKQSFPSGHTATAFVAAEFLHQEYKNKSVWISVGGYGMALFIGASRIYNNKHWVSDVIAGAGIGILSTKIVYWIYPSLQKTFRKKGTKKQILIFPAYNNGDLSINFSHTF
jgi:hypothetical protein